MTWEYANYEPQPQMTYFGDVWQSTPNTQGSQGRLGRQMFSQVWQIIYLLYTSYDSNLRNTKTMVIRLSSVTRLHFHFSITIWVNIDYPPVLFFLQLTHMALKNPKQIPKVPSLTLSLSTEYPLHWIWYWIEYIGVLCFTKMLQSNEKPEQKRW